MATTGSGSVTERIGEDLLRCLQDISTANGYQNTIADALRPNPGLGNEMVDKRLVLLQGESAREWDAPEMYTQWMQDFHVLCMVQESETSSTVIDTRLNSLAADVERCLCLNRASGNDVIVAGTGSPDCNGSYRCGVTINGQPSYVRTDGRYTLAYLSGGHWVITNDLALQPAATAWQADAGGPGGTYSGIIHASGSPTVTLVPYGGQVRGGLAEDTILDARTVVDCDDQAHDGAVLVNVKVQYRTRYNDPLTSIYD